MEQIKEIRFIDSVYRELFRITDGASINIIYPPGDTRGALTQPCSFLDETHVKVGTSVYHICELAERMEAIGARYEPTVQLQNVDIVPFANHERPFFDLRSDESSNRIEHLVGDFGNQGDRFHTYSHTNERTADKNTPEFRAELHSAIYALRQSFFNDRDTMFEFCRAHPNATLREGNDFSDYGFKLETETRRYFVLCHLAQYAHDTRFSIYAFDKAAPAHEQERTDIINRPSTEHIEQHAIKPRSRSGHAR